MARAAGRVTERVEDRAYSLLGLFNVSLEMVYGDREKAFMRLQEKIIQQSADQSIFAWSLDRDNHPRGYSGFLAPSPDCFAGSGDIVPSDEMMPFSLINIGMRIELETTPYNMYIYAAYRKCRRPGKSRSRCFILVSRTQDEDHYARVVDSQNKSLFTRYGLGSLTRCEQYERRLLLVTQTPLQIPECFERNMIYGFWLRDFGPLRKSNQIRIISRGRSQRHDSHVYSENHAIGTVGIVQLIPRTARSHPWADIRWIKVGFDSEFQPVLMFANEQGRHMIGNGLARLQQRSSSSSTAGKIAEAFEDGSWLEQKTPTT